MNQPNEIIKALVVVGIGSIATAFAAHAQQAQKVDKIEVTGSNIKRVDSETPSPIQVITRDDIQKSGANSVAELLRDEAARRRATGQRRPDCDQVLMSAFHPKRTPPTASHAP